LAGKVNNLTGFYRNIFLKLSILVCPDHQFSSIFIKIPVTAENSIYRAILLHFPYTVSQIYAGKQCFCLFVPKIGGSMTSGSLAGNAPLNAAFGAELLSDGHHFVICVSGPVYGYLACHSSGTVLLSGA